MVQRKRILVKGIVQGVGFRPFVYRLAKDYNLTGWVLNDASGVKIEFQGTPKALQNCITAISENPPILSQVTGIEVFDSETRPEESFFIKKTLRPLRLFGELN